MPELQLGSVVQVNSEYGDRAFLGCLLTITQVAAGGVHGYVQNFGKQRDMDGELRYIFLHNGQFHYVGQTTLIHNQ